jgi:hypothetical protein
MLAAPEELRADASHAIEPEQMPARKMRGRGKGVDPVVLEEIGRQLGKPISPWGIPPEPARMAKAFLLEYLLHDAMYVYGEVLGHDQQMTDARWVAETILIERLDKITIHRIVHDCSAVAGDKQRAAKALAHVHELRWIAPDESKRDKVTGEVKWWLVNPAVHEIFARRREKAILERARKLAHFNKADAFLKRHFPTEDDHNPAPAPAE